MVEMEFGDVLSGVTPGPSGSRLRDYTGVDDSNPASLVSPAGLAASEDIHSLYKGAGADFGKMATFCATPLRLAGAGDEAWDPNNQEGLELDQLSLQRILAEVKIYKKVWGKRRPVVASMAPLADTSGGDDERWKALSRSEQMRIAKARHRPQMEAMASAGVKILICEAFRYTSEAEVVAQLAKELGFRALLVSFEADLKGIPDPQAGGIGFADMKRVLQVAAGEGVAVGVGVNCVGVNLVNSLWSEDPNLKLDAVYVNSVKTLDSRLKTRLVTLLRIPEDKKTQSERDELDLILVRSQTSTTEFVNFIKDAIRRRVSVIGGCCGTGYAEVEVASLLLARAKRRRLRT
ncbi:MAG: homocysteine S-methyltransferase family protein [Candidatus Gracilibacteria bacterium]